MNDLEREIRDTLLRHQGDAPPLELSDAHRVATRARRRQVRSVVVGGIAGAAAVIVVVAGLGGLVRADRSPTVLDPPPSSPMCVATSGPEDAEVHDWPTGTRNQAGVYSWGALGSRVGVNEGFMHNAYSPGSGDVTILFEGLPGRLIPHLGETTVTVAGCEGTYRTFNGRMWGTFGAPWEQWMVDIQGTTVTISLTAGPEASEEEIAEAHEIIRSIRAQPRDDVFGFRLLFTLTTNTWDSG